MPLPDHDVAIVIASDSEDCRDALRMIDQAVPRWPRPLLNPPKLVGNLDRDKLYRLLKVSTGSRFPRRIRVTRDAAVCSRDSRPECWRHRCFSHHRPAARLACRRRSRQDRRSRGDGALSRPTAGKDFFVARFVDYAGDDGLFRKYRVVFVDGKPYACHMAIADRWDIWYLNANMAHSADKRLEEATFMRTFDSASRVATSRRLTEWPAASALIISPSTAPKPRAARC